MKIRKNIQGKLNGRCHLNSLKLHKQKGYDIYVGFCCADLRNRFGYYSYFPHFWNVSDNEIIDNSLGSKEDLLYIGKKIIGFNNSNKMFDVLLKPLYKDISIEDDFNKFINYCKSKGFKILNRNS